jgi:hypothetical protein
VERQQGPRKAEQWLETQALKDLMKEVIDEQERYYLSFCEVSVRFEYLLLRKKDYQGFHQY